MIEKTIASERIYQGRTISLRVDTIELSGGKTARREVVEHRGAVAIVALDAEKNVLLVRQYRKAAEEALLEIPAGTLNHGEDPLDCARREIQEETGYAAGQMKKLGGFYVAPGYSSEFIHLYLATELTPSRLDADEDEDIELVKVPLAEAPALIVSGEIHDGKSVAGLLTALYVYQAPA